MSFCVEFGQWSFKGDGSPLEITPTPVYVQAHSREGWRTLLIGPDVGNNRQVVVLAPKETQQYPFRLTNSGQIRLVLDYWIGENDRACENPPHRKTTKSNVFYVR